ncbi:MAG: M28 family peptidase [Planctomycetota bacterium]|nr:M28 family peptidase [Planctomycetaceae bacterium]MDQ3330248.1 M28 family peptidase [Planctomycetota bacterium]
MRLNSYRRALAAFSLLMFAACLPAFAENREAAIGRITADVTYLASDALEGRGVETAGNQKAADYVRKALEDAGLKGGMPDGSYFQPFTISLGEELKPEETKLAIGGDESHSLELGKDFQPLYLGGTGAAKAPLVFAGYGISAPGLKYDDYADVDVKGKVVLILRKEPQQNDPHSAFDGTDTTAHAYVRTKITAAEEHGAAAVLIVNDSGTIKEEEGTDKLVKPNAFGDGAAKIPFGQITRVKVDELLAEAPLKSGDKTFSTLTEIESHIDDTFSPMTQPLGEVTADLEFAFNTREVGVVNVIAKVPGEKEDEFVVVGAHFDHIGYGGAGSRKPGVHEIHNGADDNASGTSAMLELARRVASGQKPSRTIIFMGFNGEERGLLGSNYYVEHPVVPLDKTIAMLNFDMVGRLGDNPLTVYGVGSATEFDELIAKASEDREYEVKPVDGVMGASDHYGFFLKRVPVFHFFTGLTEQYHTPSDDVETLNLPGIVNAVDFSETVLEAVLKDDDGFEYVEAPTESPSRGDMAYLGVVPDYSGGTNGLKINGAGKDSPAEKAGLQAGDVITKFGDLAIGDVQGLADALRKYKPGDKLKVIVRRDDNDIELEVELGAPRGSKK